MSLITKTFKNGKRTVTSSYFQDIVMLRKAKQETDYRGLKDAKFDLAALRNGWAVTEIMLWKKGCRELTAYAESLKPAQLEGLTLKYMGEDVDTEDQSLARVMTDEEYAEFCEKKLPHMTR